MTRTDPLFERYQELQQYVGWVAADADRVRSVAPLIESRIPELLDDFYEEIQRHPDAVKVITGGEPQIERLKRTLTQWLRDLLHGPYNAAYVARRWAVGSRHVEIGLDQVHTNVAVSRLRRGILQILQEGWTGPSNELLPVSISLNLLLDLDLAIIEGAYQAEHLNRQQQVERLAAIGQLAGGIAHELRNPLNVIRTSVYYLVNARRPSPEKTAEHLQRIEKQVGQADGVITALSSFAKLPLPNLERFSVGPFLQEVLETSELPAAIETQVESPPSLAAALADVGQLQIVLANLIRNARDAMPEGGQLTLTASETDGGIDITVTDNGEGIAPENLSRIMQPLFTTKARGIGLGLSMARAIVEKNDGTLTVESTPGEGSTFTIRLRKETPAVL